MNREKLISLVNDPAAISAKECDELQKVVEQFPYFQTARLLLLKGLHNSSDSSYAKQLPITSAYAVNRENLYRLVMREALQEVIQKQEREQEQRPERQEQPQMEAPPVKPFISEIKVEQPEGTSKEVDATKTESTSEADTPAPSPEKQEPVSTDPLSVLEEEILKEAVVASIEQDIELLTRDEFRKEVTEDATPKESAESSETRDKAEKKEPEVQSQEVVNDNGRDEVSGSHSFSYWLNRGKADITEAGNREEQPGATVESDSRSSSRVEKDSIIEKFINLEPRMPTPKKEFFSPVNMAKLSVTDNQDFVTETLAKVYAKQGQYEKAIGAYERLILKFPEKSRYFAARIDEVKDLRSKNQKSR